MTLKQVILCPCASDKQGEACVPPPCSMGYIYIYTYLYISSISPTSFDPFFFSRRGEKENLALFLFFQTSILQVKRLRLVPSHRLWFKNPFGASFPRFSWEIGSSK